MRSRWSAGLLVAAALLVAGCGDVDGGRVAATTTVGAPGQTVTSSAAAMPGGPVIPADAEGPYPVTDVVDGDTVKVRIDGTETTLRVIGIDTPETTDPRRPVECFGREASAWATRLLVGQRVKLSYDRSQGRTDRYDRTLAYVWLPDGRSFQWAMLNDGYAAEYTYDLPYLYQEDFKVAQASARDNERGLWSDDTCAGDLDLPAQPAPTTVTSTAPFENCTAARDAGAAPVHRGTPGYGAHLDGDGDGIACE